MEGFGRHLRWTAALSLGFMACVPTLVVQANSCDAGPVVTPAESGTQLEAIAEAWGAYCEGSASWSRSAGPEGLTLVGGGDPYANVHFYRHLTFQSPDSTYMLELEFDLPETTLANQGAPSVVQAIEFVVSAWDGQRRHEWAIQWTNVGPNGPEWRYWDPAGGWMSLGIPAPLTPGSHRLELQGRVTKRGTELRSFTIDGATHRTRLDVGSVPAGGIAPIVAVAIQLDGNHAGDAYAVTVRDVHLHRR